MRLNALPAHFMAKIHIQTKGATKATSFFIMMSKPGNYVLLEIKNALFTII